MDQQAQATMNKLQQELGGKELTQENYAALEEKKRQQEEMKASMLARICTPDALDRINRIKLVKPDVANQVEMTLLNAAQKGQLPGKVDENRVKGLLANITASEAKAKKVTIQRKSYFSDEDSDDNDDDLL